MALPLGGSALVLVYRRDAMGRQPNVEAAGKAGIKLEPPTTWTQLDALAKFFSGRDWDGDGSPDHGLVAALGPDPEGVGDATFLARAASLGQHRDQYSFLFDADEMGPRIDSPPFVEALRGIASWKAFGPPGMEKFDAPAAREAFRKGKARHADRSGRAGRDMVWRASPRGRAAAGFRTGLRAPAQDLGGPFGPNTPSYLPNGGGWLVGVKRGLSGPRRDAAIDLARYLSSPENANRLRGSGPSPCCRCGRTQMGQGLPDPTSGPRRGPSAMDRGREPYPDGRPRGAGSSHPGLRRLSGRSLQGEIRRRLGQGSRSGTSRGRDCLDRAATRARGKPAAALALSPQPQQPGHAAPAARSGGNEREMRHRCSPIMES